MIYITKLCKPSADAACGKSVHSEVGYGFSATKDHRTKLKQINCNKQFVDQHHLSEFPVNLILPPNLRARTPAIVSHDLHDHTHPSRLTSVTTPTFFAIGGEYFS